MLIENKLNHIMKYVKSIERASTLSKNDIIKQYGTFDKYLHSINDVCSYINNIYDIPTTDPQPPQPIIINGQATITINPSLMNPSG